MPHSIFGICHAEPYSVDSVKGQSGVLHAGHNKAVGFADDLSQGNVRGCLHVMAR